VDITDDRGRGLEEVTLRLNPQEVADLLEYLATRK